MTRIGISDIATDPNLTPSFKTGPGEALLTKAGDPAKVHTYGVRDGTSILMVSKPLGEGIITGFPKSP